MLTYSILRKCLELLDYQQCHVQIDSFQWTLYVCNVYLYTMILAFNIDNIVINPYYLVNPLSSHLLATFKAGTLSCLMHGHDIVVFILFDTEIVTPFLKAEITCLTYFEAWLLQWCSQLAVYWNGFCYIVCLLWLLMVLKLHFDLQMALKEVAVKVSDIAFQFFEGVFIWKNVCVCLFQIFCFYTSFSVYIL